MQATRVLLSKMKSNVPIADITLHQHLRNRAGEIYKTSNHICKQEGIIVSAGSYGGIVGAVTLLEGMEYLGKKYLLTIIKDPTSIK